MIFQAQNISLSLGNEASHLGGSKSWTEKYLMLVVWSLGMWKVGQKNKIWYFGLGIQWSAIIIWSSFSFYAVQSKLDLQKLEREPALALLISKWNLKDMLKTMIKRKWAMNFLEETRMIIFFHKVLLHTFQCNWFGARTWAISVNTCPTGPESGWRNNVSMNKICLNHGTHKWTSIYFFIYATKVNTDKYRFWKVLDRKNKWERRILV